MKRLILFRHAKSDWDDPVARDFDRPLNSRGEKAALVMGQFARAQNIRFDMVVASPAVRVVETLNVFFTGYGEVIDPHWDRRIYLASTPTLFDVIKVIRALFPFDPALDAISGGLEAAGPGLGVPILHLAILTVAYGVLARLALRRFAA